MKFLCFYKAWMEFVELCKLLFKISFATLQASFKIEYKLACIRACFKKKLANKTAANCCKCTLKLPVR